MNTSLTRVASAAALALSGSWLAAHAQTAPAAPARAASAPAVETIEVTGIRAAVLKSLI